VLVSYGTGAIMAVPAHDQRDFEFAKAFDIPVIAVVDPGDSADVDREAVLAGEACATFDGTAVNSGPYDGLPTSEFKQKIIADLNANGRGRAAVNYKLRDWLFSRQRFWGEPFPILHELDENGQPTGNIRAVPDDQLPVDLPDLEDFKPPGTPEPPLGKSPDEWLYVELDGKRYRRETNTMPQWAGSCWYYLRFIDPGNGEVFVDPEKERAWMPVDLYIGGAEHAVLHLLYARFWHKVLYDRGHVSTAEPFQRLVNQGMILGEPEFFVSVRLDKHHNLTDIYVSEAVVANEMKEAEAERRRTGATWILDEAGEYKIGSYGQKRVPKKEVEIRNGNPHWIHDGNAIEVSARAEKMSKSRGNVINPDDIVTEYGADSLRLFEMFMGPLEATKPWSMAGVKGVKNFLDRAWRMILDDNAETRVLNADVTDDAPSEEQLRMLHKTIDAVTRDTENLSFNTAIARMMEFVNFQLKQSSRPRSVLEQFVLLLSPYAPHLGEELWEALGHDITLAYEPWPQVEEKYLKEDSIEIPVQILGKVRSRVTVPADATDADKLAAAKADERIASVLEGKQIIKEIVAKGKLVNFVVK